MRTLYTICLTSLLSFLSTDSVHSQWIQTNGPCGGVVECFALSGTNVFAGTYGGVYLSTNNGNSWVNRGLTNTHIWSLATNGTKLLAGTNAKGIYLSTNDGSSWSQIDTGLTTATVYSFIIDDTNIFAGTTAGIYLSTNNGNTWSQMDTGLTYTAVYSLAKSDTNIFAGTNGGVFLSTNNGTNWTQINNGLPATTVNSLAISDTDILAGTNLGIYLSTNKGSDWTALDTTVRNIKSLIVRGSNIYAGTISGGLFLSTNFGTSWTNTGLPTTYIYSLAATDGNIFAGTLSGIFISTDNGTTWSQVNTGLISTIVNAFAVRGANILAGTYYGGVYRSPDNGINWTQVNAGLTNKWIYAFAVRGSNLFAGSYGSGVFLSTDTGSSWTQISNGLTNGNVLSLLATDTNIFVATHGGGVYVSTNDGSNWTQANNGLTALNVYSLVLSGTNLFAATQGGGVCVSTNSGSSWTQVNNGLTNLNVYCLALHNTNLFAGTMNGIFLSTNNGTSWTPVNTGLTSLYVRSLAVGNNNIFAGTFGSGVFVSMNEGTSWSQVNAGLTNTTVYSLAAVDTNLFVGTYGAGAWVQPLHNITGYITSVTDMPNDQGGKVRISWDRVYLDASGSSPEIVSYGIWRKIPAGPRLINGNQSGMFTANDTLGTFYDCLGTVDAVQSPSYHFTAETLDDSSQSGLHAETFLVSAHTGDPNIYFIFEPASGYSVDNLAPQAPQNFAAIFVNGSVIMHWQKNSEKDLSEYILYRGTADSLEEVIGQTIDTNYVDQNPVIDKMYYAVRAEDVHGNISPMCVPVLTGLDDNAVLPISYALQQNWPNPFNPSTRIRYQIPEQSMVRVQVFNILGQVVALLHDGIQNAGYKEVEWVASSFSSGIYVYTLQATSVADPRKTFTQVKKMVLIR